MTYTEQAIQKAIEGGWKPKHSGFKNCINIVEVLETFKVFYPDIESIKQSGHSHEYFLNPLFWQSMGKSLGWKNRHTFYNNFLSGKECDDPWRLEMHRFIDHLASGEDVESFFKEILK